MRIGELARRSGVSERSLRYYEEQRLLDPDRSQAGHRIYEPDDVDRVIGIQELFAAGFCSAVIRELLPEIVGTGDPDAQRLRAGFAAARHRLEDELRDIRRELRELEQLRIRLGIEPEREDSEGVAPDTRVNPHPGPHERSHEYGSSGERNAAPPAPSDHRDRRLR